MAQTSMAPMHGPPEHLRWPLGGGFASRACNGVENQRSPQEISILSHRDVPKVSKSNDLSIRGFGRAHHLGLCSNSKASGMREIVG